MRCGLGRRWRIPACVASGADECPGLAHQAVGWAVVFLRRHSPTAASQFPRLTQSPDYKIVPRFLRECYMLPPARVSAARCSRVLHHATLLCGHCLRALAPLRQRYLFIEAYRPFSGLCCGQSEACLYRDWSRVKGSESVVPKRTKWRMLGGCVASQLPKLTPPCQSALPAVQGTENNDGKRGRQYTPAAPFQNHVLFDEPVFAKMNQIRHFVHGLEHSGKDVVRAEADRAHQLTDARGPGGSL